MIPIVDVLIIAGLFLLFGVSHSILASRKIKSKLADALGNKIAFYRLFYNVSSLIIFYVIYKISPKPGIEIFDLPNPFDLMIFGLQLLSLFGLIWAVKPINASEFLGISQIKRYVNGTYNINDLDEKLTFHRKGAFKYTRHPVYFFSILFLGLRPAYDLFYLTFFLCITAYFIVGSYYEEKKLVKIFGDEYLQYQKDVPRIIPIKIFNKK
ncbi:MAG: hypothetical protein K9J16_04605 [Melioribacteraceae bacterium]|nr:hypothetical protein [Melioribacteraceae bacterium]MCF8355408.1 hypothetical protein [Melioribacteraceae bacterium]MCF8393250.1 hypothetical protein [Melioribacteraceae bacterium]MCF8417551.1 hypothetical protein [Melioribacteraceae bacterium]